jgi:hypothetical protein
VAPKKSGIFVDGTAALGAVANIATHPEILYTFGVEYPFPPVGIVGAADGKNRRAFLFAWTRDILLG